MDAHTGSDGKQSEALFKALPTLLDEPSYAKEFKPVRSCLADQTPPCVFTDSELWGTIVEPCAWQFLVHREFMEKEVQDFEVVRVCIKKNKTAVLDSPAPRTPALGGRASPAASACTESTTTAFEQTCLRRSATTRPRQTSLRPSISVTLIIFPSSAGPSWARLGRSSPQCVLLQP